MSKALFFPLNSVEVKVRNTDRSDTVEVSLTERRSRISIGAAEPSWGQQLLPGFIASQVERGKSVPKIIYFFFISRDLFCLLSSFEPLSSVYESVHAEP